MASLSPSELLKYDWRVDKFIEKYEAGEPFELNSGQSVKLLIEKENLVVLMRRKNSEYQKLEFIDARVKTRTYKLSSFKKTVEFGGKPDGGGVGVGIETREINSINKQFDEIRSKTGLGYIPIKVKNFKYQAVSCIKTFGVPKSDFSILDKNGNEIIWLSHKEGSTPRDFQQWGGMTDPAIASHPESQDFIQQMQDMFPEGIPRATTVAKEITSFNLQAMAIYGVDYSKSSPFGLNNVSVVLQGPVKVTKYGNSFEFKANHSHENGDRMSGGYTPVFMCMYKGDRSQFGVAGARFAIQPRDSRAVTQWIE